MKQLMFVVTAVALLGVPTSTRAQWLGMPVWNTPKGGTGLTISGDYGHPDNVYSNGNAWGGRVSLGLSTLSLTAGVAGWKPGLASTTQTYTSLGGDAAMRLIGGSLLPVAVNLQVGAARTDSANGVPAQTAVTAAVGLSVPLPAPYLTIEPYVSPGVRYRHLGGAIATNDTEFGYAVGANVGYGQLGLHLAYDYEKVKGGGSRSVFGIGADFHVGLALGM